MSLRRRKSAAGHNLLAAKDGVRMLVGAGLMNLMQVQVSGVCRRVI